MSEGVDDSKHQLGSGSKAAAPLYNQALVDSDAMAMATAWAKPMELGRW
jgi:hypothetical protein